MFAILQFSDTNTILRAPKIHSQRLNLPSGDAFFMVTTDKHLGKVPWKKLGKCLGILRNNILLSDDITIPLDINITCFTPEILPHLLLINSATDYILKHKQGFISKSMTIFDKKAIYQNHIKKLVPCFRSIKIITPHPDRYESLSRELLEHYGFSLVITDEENYDSDVIITHQCKVPIYFEGVIFTNENRYLMNAEVLSGSDIDLPDLYESMRPHNIDRIQFASALYETCKEKDLGAIIYKDFAVDI